MILKFKMTSNELWGHTLLKWKICVFIMLAIIDILILEKKPKSRSLGVF